MTAFQKNDRIRKPVTCAYYDVSTLDDPALATQHLRQLPWPERQEQVMRYRFANDRRLCLGAGLLAADLLRKSGATDLTLGYGPHGKPYLLNHPTIHFNLSHSGSLAVCVVADAPVGVDVETILSHGREVAGFCLQPVELAWLDRADDTARAFTRLWVRKESYIKLIGTGLSREPRTVCVLPDGPSERDAFFTEFEIGDSLVSVCMHDDREVRLVRWSPPRPAAAPCTRALRWTPSSQSN